MNTQIALQLARGINKNPSKQKRDFSDNNNASEETSSCEEESIKVLRTDLNKDDSITCLTTDNWLKYYNYLPKFI